jgi:ubiquinone/menaquinone biosynthesis C-methylase UbiE
MKHEPTYLEIFLTKLVFLFCGRSVYQSFADNLPLFGGEQVLDFGCGMGTVAYYVAKKLTNGKLTCLDISDRWLKTCRKSLRRFDNVIFQKLESLTLANECYDVVYCHFVLHDIPDCELEKLVPVLAGSLKPGGVLVFREPLSNTTKIKAIKHLIEQNALILKNSRITDIPVAGNTLEAVYVKE